MVNGPPKIPSSRGVGHDQPSVPSEEVEVPLEKFCEDPSSPVCQAARAADAHSGTPNGRVSLADVTSYVLNPDANVSLDVLLNIARIIRDNVPALKAAHVQLAVDLTVALGEATREDVDLTVDKLTHFPTEVLKLMKKVGMGVVVCRQDVTDAVRSLKGERPRGWSEGSTWDNPGVPGMFFPSGIEGSEFKTNIVVATVAKEPSRPQDRSFPETGNRHGSADLFVHESGHGINANFFKAVPFLFGKSSIERGASPSGGLVDANAAAPPSALPAPPIPETTADLFKREALSSAVANAELRCDQRSGDGSVAWTNPDTGKREILRWTRKEIIELGIKASLKMHGIENTRKAREMLRRETPKWQLVNLGFEVLAGQHIVPRLARLPKTQQRLVMFHFYNEVLEQPPSVSEILSPPPPPAVRSTDGRSAVEERAAQLARQKGAILFSQWDVDFLDARTADWANLGPYYTQGGQDAIFNGAGADEWFVESMAMYFNYDPARKEELRTLYPATFAYWASNPLAKPYVRIDPNR